ncbi:MAG TPA: type II toxin-antitoxin system VapC family toxin [Chthoniobacterales bacterium]
MKYLLDTDVCIAVLRGSLRVRERLQAVRPDDCGISVVSIFELLSGVECCRRPEEERRKVETFIAPMHVLPFDQDSALRAAQVRWHLEKVGRPIGPYDLLLAGQALAVDVTLVTGNTTEFARVPNLVLENWVE